MTRLQQALAFTEPFEGGFSDNPLDHGGATNKGITFTTLKDASARLLGHTHDPMFDGTITINILKNLTDEEVEDIVTVEGFWPDTLEIIDINVAIKAFDLAFNMGIRSGFKLLQMAVNTVVGRPLITVDGCLGPASTAAISAQDPKALLTTLVATAVAHYNAVVALEPSQSIFLKGWLRRANALPSAD